MNNSNTIDFNFISYMLIFVRNVLMTYFGKKKKTINNCLNVKFKLFKIVQNLLGALYTLVHLAHFPCTVSVISLYNDTNFIFLLSYMSK